MGLVYLLVLLSLSCVHGHGIPTTLEGPFKPVTAPLEKSFRGQNFTDLPDVPSNVEGFQPQQIFVSLSTNYDSIWISWITGLSLVLSFFSYIVYLIILEFMAHEVLVSLTFSALYITKLMCYNLHFLSHSILIFVNKKFHCYKHSNVTENLFSLKFWFARK